MSRFRRSWSLVRASWGVMLTHRMLLVYPIVSGTVVAILGGLLPLALVWVHLTGQENDPGFSVRGSVAIAIVYVVTSAVVLFCNVALVAEALARFDGLPRARPAGWAIAVAELRGIVPHAVFASGPAALAYLVLGKVGTWLRVPHASTLITWSLGTFLAVPVLVAQRVGPREAVERGAALIRATWGDRFIGGLGFVVVKILLVAAAVFLGVLVVLLSALTGFAPLVLVVVLLVIAAITFMVVVGSAVSMIYSVAIYRHVTGRPVAGFEVLDTLPRPVVVPDDVVPAVEAG
jgi:hypothetical protein